MSIDPSSNGHPKPPVSLNRLLGLNNDGENCQESDADSQSSGKTKAHPSENHSGTQPSSANADTKKMEVPIETPESDSAKTSGVQCPETDDASQPSAGKTITGKKTQITNIGNPIPYAAQQARGAARVKLKGKATELRYLIRNLEANLASQRKRLRSYEINLWWLDPFTIEPEQRKPMGTLGWMMIILLLFLCVFFAFVENFAAASILTGLAAFNITNICEAQALLSTALIAGLALSLAIKPLPSILTNRIYVAILVVFTVFSAAYFLSLGVSVGRFADQVNSFLDEPGAMEDAPLEWLMFSSIVAMNILSAAIFKISLAKAFRTWDVEVENPRYGRISLEIELVENQIDQSQKALAKLKGELAYLRDWEQYEANQVNPGLG